MRQDNRISTQEAPKYNRLKWTSVLFLLIAGIVANSYYDNVAWALRAAIGIIIFAGALSVAFQTSQGKSAWTFIKSARTEIRKVVWPTRQETIQTTLVVVAMVVVASLVLWGFDYIFYHLVGWLAGQRG